MSIEEFIRQKTVELLDFFLSQKGKTPADRVVQRFYAKYRFNSSKRRAVSEAFYNVIRHYWSLCERPELLSAEALFEVSQSQGLKARPQGNISPLLWPLFEASFLTPEDALAEAQALQKSAPCDVRVNTFTGVTKRDVLRTLCAEGNVVEELPLAGLRLRQRGALEHSEAYRNGKFEIQDFGSQIVAYLCDIAPNRHVLDYCAGGGGKTLAFLNALGMAAENGHITATDWAPKRLESARHRFERIPHFPWSKVRLMGFDALNQTQETFDVVVVDAPCSGLGTLRRNPDKALFLTPESVKHFSQLQIKILNQAARFVRPGGRLVYITCSLLQAENEDVVDAFLELQKAFVCRPLFELSIVKGRLAHRKKAVGIQLTPGKTHTDGFFMAILQKQSAH